MIDRELILYWQDYVERLFSRMLSVAEDSSDNKLRRALEITCAITGLAELLEVYMKDVFKAAQVENTINFLLAGLCRRTEKALGNLLADTTELSKHLFLFTFRRDDDDDAE